MNDILNGLQAAMAKLPMWGQLAVMVALTLFGVWAKKKLTPQGPPAVPTPPASPATNPLALGPQFPLLNLLLQGLGIVPKGQTGTTADIPHTLIAQIDSEVSGVKQAHIDAHKAALGDLGAPVVDAPAPPAAAAAAK